MLGFFVQPALSADKAEFNECCVHTQQRGTVHILLLCAVLRHRCCWVPAAVDQYVARLVLSSKPAVAAVE